MLVDLHMHTYYSDGTMSPEEIVEVAKERNVEVISITDHNIFKGWDRFRIKAISEGLVPIKGVEINVRYKDKILHLLAYSFENTEKLIKLIDKALEELQKNSVDLIAKLQLEDNRVSSKDFDLYDYDRKRGGWKGLHYLFDRGVTSKLFDGFKYYNKYDCGYEKYDFPALEEVCKAIKEANGFAILAHPAEYYKELSKEELINQLEALRKTGIDGIECYYPTHSIEMTETCVEFCNKYDLITTSGSDEHGEFGKEAKVLEQTIGCMSISKKELNNIEKLISNINA